MSERFPDFDLKPLRGRGWSLTLTDSTYQAGQLIREELQKYPKLKRMYGQDLWMGGRAIILELVERGEIVRVGTVWDIP